MLLSSRFNITISTALDSYTLEEILELNDVTIEECLEFLVEHRLIKLPEIQALDFD